MLPEQVKQKNDAESFVNDFQLQIQELQERLSNLETTEANAPEPAWQVITPKTTITGADATITLSSIPSGYAMIRVLAMVRSDAALNTDLCYGRLNSDSGGNYETAYLAHNGTGTTASGATEMRLGQIGGNNNTDRLSNIDFWIANYDDASHRRGWNGVGNNHQNRYGFSFSGWWANAADAITQIDLFPNSGTNFKVGSWYMLLGMIDGN